MDEFLGGMVTLSLQWNYRETRGKENPSSFVHSPWNVKIPSGRRNGYTTEQQDHSTIMHNGFRTRGAAARNQPSYERKDLGGNPTGISGTNYSDRLYFDIRRAKGAVRFTKAQPRCIRLEAYGYDWSSAAHSGAQAKYP
ncbi:hypothetical protein Tco_1482013 [Tanacetum coccineum]